MKIVITGAAGFIGSHIAKHLLETYTDAEIYLIDKLSYASSGLDRLRIFDLLHQPQVHVLTTDLAEPLSEGLEKEIGYNVDYILHLAAESHVDNSIADPRNVVLNNIKATLTILDFARKQHRLVKFVHFSTDEVFGDAGIRVDGFNEYEPHRPSNPYSASKSSAEQICRSYCNCYNVPLVTIHCSNVYGTTQHVEKFVPKCISLMLQDKPVYIHTDINVDPCTRSYIHVTDVGRAVNFIMKNGYIGHDYNLPGKSIDVLTLARKIHGIIRREVKHHVIPEDKYEFLNLIEGRPNHDVRYLLDGGKLHDLGFRSKIDFDQGLEDTVKWYLNNSWI